MLKRLMQNCYFAASFGGTYSYLGRNTHELQTV